MMMNVKRLKMPMMIYMITGDGRGGSRTAHDMIIYDDIYHGMI